jgi:hypothetical protein
MSQKFRLETRKREKHSGWRTFVYRKNAYDFLDVSRGEVIGTLAPVNKQWHAEIGDKAWLFSKAGDSHNTKYPDISVKNPDSDEEIALYRQVDESEGAIQLGEAERYTYDRSSGRKNVLWRADSSITEAAGLDRKARKLALLARALISYQTEVFPRVRSEIHVADLATTEPHVQNYELLMSLGALLNLRYDAMEFRENMGELSGDR